MKDKSTNEISSTDLYDTGEFKFFTFGRGYIPPQNDTNKPTTIKEDTNKREIKFFDGNNGVGYAYYELTSKENEKLNNDLQLNRNIVTTQLT